MERARRKWQVFKASQPGQRFREEYGRRQRNFQGRWTPRRSAHIALGLALVAGGLVFFALPGPGWVLVVIGLALLARELGPVARALDWSEVRGRALGGRVRDAWRRSPGMRALMVLSAAAVAGLLGVGAYFLFSS